MRYRQILEACWKGYSQKGMKPKSGKMVPNCVPVSEQELEEDLRKWFKEKWVRFGPDGKIRGPCARGSKSEGKPKCLPQKKAHSLGKKKRASAAARKRREDPNPERRGKAKNVATKKKTNENTLSNLTNPYELTKKIDSLMLKVQQVKDPVERNYYMQQIKMLTDQIYKLQKSNKLPLQPSLRNV